MDEIQVGILIEKLKYLNLWNRKRNLVAKNTIKKLKIQKSKLKELSRKRTHFIYM